MTSSTVHFAIIVAGGTGSRMQTDQPKQFLQLGNKPMIIHTITRFLQAIPNIRVIVVVHHSWKDHLDDLISKHIPNAAIQVTTGGTTRFHSVKNGLKHITGEEGKVAVHDAVRPLVQEKVIQQAMEATEPGIGVLPAIASRDSIRKITDGHSVAVDRSQYRLVQTPQCFMVQDLKAAYNLPYQPAFTDDASVTEANGSKVQLIAGNDENIKITTPMDMKLAQLIMGQENATD